MVKKRPIDIDEIVYELKERGLLNPSQKTVNLKEYNEKQKKPFNNTVRPKTKTFCYCGKNNSTNQRLATHHTHQS